MQRKSANTYLSDTILLNHLDERDSDGCGLRALILASVEREELAAPFSQRGHHCKRRRERACIATKARKKKYVAY